MKVAVILLLALVPLAAAVKNNECSIENGNEMNTFQERSLRIKAPCKFNAILQECGDYRVTVTPGLKFLYPRYIIDKVWLGVHNTKTFQFWEGWTSNKKTALRIIKGKNPINQKDGNYTTDELFDISNTTHDVTIAEKDGVFSLTVGPYDFNGGKHKDSKLSFVCNEENEPSSYPTQFCESESGNELKDRADLLFAKKDLDLLMLFDIFNDSSIAQIDDACIDATHVLTQECTNDTKRKEAIKTCHQILDSTPHTKCVLKYACDPMDIFVNCLRYVCSDYKDGDACATVGQAIDLCREFKPLSSKVEEANCYEDFLTGEDNPYYEE